jgi:hypothetical protein
MLESNALRHCTQPLLQPLLQGASTAWKDIAAASARFLWF